VVVVVEEVEGLLFCLGVKIYSIKRTTPTLHNMEKEECQQVVERTVMY